MWAIGVTRPTAALVSAVSQICLKLVLIKLGRHQLPVLEVKATFSPYPPQIQPRTAVHSTSCDLVRRLPRNTQRFQVMPLGLDPSPKASLAILVVSGILLFGFALPRSREKAEIYKRRFYLQSPFQKKIQAEQEKPESEGQE